MLLSERRLPEKKKKEIERNAVNKRKGKQTDLNNEEIYADSNIEIT